MLVNKRKAATMKSMAAIVALLASMPSGSAFTPVNKMAMRTLNASPFAVHPSTPWKESALYMSDQTPVEKPEDINKPVRKKSTDPTPVLVSFLKDSMGIDPRTAFAATLLALTLALAPLSASAAMSGGRMGGSFSAPRSSTMRSVPSRSYYGGGGGGWGYSSRPNIIVAPTITPFYNPFYTPAPYYGGAGVVTYGGGGGFGLFNLFFLGFGAWALLNIVPSLLAPRASFSSTFEEQETMSALGPGTSVVQISVALEVPNRDDPNSILSVLDRLSRTAKTDSRVGIQNMTSQIAMELLRRKASISSAWTHYKHFEQTSKAQREFQQQSIKERAKFEQETVSKYGGVDYSMQRESGSGGLLGVDHSKATMAVVTILMAIDGDSTKLPQISSIRDVEEALRKIASDAKTENCLQSAEILWTPESRYETLTTRDVIADYPELRSV